MPTLPKCIVRKIRCVKDRLKGSKAKGQTVNQKEQSTCATSEAWCILPENSHEAQEPTQDHDSLYHEDTTVRGQVQKNQREGHAPYNTQHIEARSSQQNTPSSTRHKKPTTATQNHAQPSGLVRNGHARHQNHGQTPSVIREEMESLPIDPEDGSVAFKPLDLVREDYELVRNPAEEATQNHPHTSGQVRNGHARHRNHGVTTFVLTEEMESLPEKGTVAFKPLDLVREDYELVRNPAEEVAPSRNTGPYNDGPNVRSDSRRRCYDGDFVLLSASSMQAQAHTAIRYAVPNNEDACAATLEDEVLTNDEHLMVNAAAPHDLIVDEFKKISLQDETGTLYEWDVARYADGCTDGRALGEEPVWESNILGTEPPPQTQNVDNSNDIESDWVIVESVPPMNVHTSEGSRIPATTSIANTSRGQLGQQRTSLNRRTTKSGRIQQTASSSSYSNSSLHSPMNLLYAESKQRTLQTSSETKLIDDPQHLNLRSAEARRPMVRSQSMSPSQQRQHADQLSRTSHTASSFPMPVTHSKSPRSPAMGWSSVPLEHHMNKVLKDVMNYALIQEGVKSLERPVDALSSQSMQEGGAGESEDMDAWTHGCSDATHVVNPDETSVKERLDHDDTYVKERLDHDDTCVKERLDHDDTYAKERLDHDDTYIKEKLDHDDTYVKERLDHDDTYVKERIDHGDTYVKERLDNDETFVKERIDHCDTYVKERLDHDETFVKERIDHDDTYVKERLDHDDEVPALHRPSKRRSSTCG